MKIMFAVASYWPSQDGVANITKYLAEGLAAHGNKVLVYTGSGNGGTLDLPEKEMNAGVDIERIRVFVRWPLKIKACDERSSRECYLARIREYQPDVLIVVCSQTWTFDWIRSSLCKIKCPKIFYCHGYSLLKDHYPYWEKLKHRNILGVWEQYLCKKYYDDLYKDLARFDLAIYLTEEDKAVKYALQHGLSNGKILENAIEDVFFESDIRHQYNMDESNDEINFLFVANYNENKNQQMIIEAFQKAQIGKSRLIFAGYEENKYLDSLKSYADNNLKNHPEKNVLFYVHLERKQVVDLYRISDIFVCSSRSEIYPVVAYEAAAAALPVISTDVGFYSEIPGTVIVHSVEEMKNAMEKLYNSFEDRKRSGEANYQWLCSKNCRIQDKVDWLENEIIRLCEGKANC